MKQQTHLLDAVKRNEDDKGHCQGHMDGIKDLSCLLPHDKRSRDIKETEERDRVPGGSGEAKPCCCCRKEEAIQEKMLDAVNIISERYDKFSEGRDAASEPEYKAQQGQGGNGEPDTLVKARRCMVPGVEKVQPCHIYSQHKLADYKNCQHERIEAPEALPG